MASAASLGLPLFFDVADIIASVQSGDVQEITEAIVDQVCSVLVEPGS